MVAMARTGSGKTAAFLLPLFQRLRCHSAVAGARGLILSPTRELALQAKGHPQPSARYFPPSNISAVSSVWSCIRAPTHMSLFHKLWADERAATPMRQTHKFSRDMGHFLDVRCCCLVGGEALEQQFEALAANPDILVATPGRLLHHLSEARSPPLCFVEPTPAYSCSLPARPLDLPATQAARAGAPCESNLAAAGSVPCWQVEGMSLRAVEVAVLDEADRLFEMGFAEQLRDIWRALPDQRQTLLFSATMPQQLAEFAQARSPQLVQ